MGNLLGDVRYAVRSLARQPTFAGVAILTLVLGIGTNTAIFSVIKAVLLNQLPYQDASRLVVVRGAEPGRQPRSRRAAHLSGLEGSSRRPFRRWPRSGSCATRLPATASRSTSRACGRRANMFAVLRANAMLGRTFSAEEGAPGADRVAVLSRAVLGAALRRIAGAIGQTIQLDAQPYTVIGVMPARIRFPAERERRHLDAAQLRSERRARPLAQGALAERRRPPRRRRARRSRRSAR